jgi:hypothetical protein
MSFVLVKAFRDPARLLNFHSVQSMSRLDELQGLHNGARFPIVWAPPRLIGIRCSTVDGAGASHAMQG